MHLFNQISKVSKVGHFMHFMWKRARLPGTVAGLKNFFFQWQTTLRWMSRHRVCVKRLVIPVSKIMSDLTARLK